MHVYRWMNKGEKKDLYIWKESLSVHLLIYLFAHPSESIFLLGFAPCKAESHYQEWSYKKKKYKKINA